MRESEKVRERGCRGKTTSHSPFWSILELNHLNIVMSSALLLTNDRKLNFSAQLTYCQS